MNDARAQNIKRLEGLGFLDPSCRGCEEHYEYYRTKWKPGDCGPFAPSHKPNPGLSERQAPALHLPGLLGVNYGEMALRGMHLLRRARWAGTGAITATTPPTTRASRAWRAASPVLTVSARTGRGLSGSASRPVIGHSESPQASRSSRRVRDHKRQQNC